MTKIKIKKVGALTPLVGKVLNLLSNSTYDAYSCDYVNKAIKDSETSTKNILSLKIAQSTIRVINTDGEAVKTGNFIDGKPEYVKRVSFGALPNATTAKVASGIDFSKNTLVDIRGVCKANANSTSFPIPFVSATDTTANIAVNIDSSGNIVVNTGSNRSTYTANFMIYYTSDNLEGVE